MPDSAGRDNAGRERLLFSHGGAALGAGAPLRDWQAGLSAAFAAAGVRTPQIDARLLLMSVLGLSHGQIIMNPMRPVTAAEAAKITACGERRLAREPLSRIAGRREFYGRDFLLTSATLDPRPDTETVIEAALAIVRAEAWGSVPLRILELGAGSGAIILTLLCELPQAEGLAIDISSAALDAARVNAERLNVGGRVRFQRGDWLEGVSGAFHIVVSNPPYIPTADIAGLAPEVAIHEPRIAIDGGLDGLDAYRAIAPRLGDVLAPGGWAVFEVGQGQAQAVGRLLVQQGLGMDAPELCLRQDLGGIERVVCAKR